MDSANRRYPSSRWWRTLGGGKAQSWPLGEKASGGGQCGRRKAPVRALGREVVGGRAHAAAGGVEGAMGPQVRAEAVGGESQIVVEPDGEMAVARVALGAAQLDVDLDRKSTR